jgi:hypothetical protein
MKPQSVPPVQLLVGVLEADGGRFVEARRLLAEAFGLEESLHGPWPFDLTDYYDQEMGGAEIRRWFLAYAEPVLSEQLAEVKLITNRIEDELAIEGRRRVNLDSGYLDFQKLVLASAKFHTCKIHVGRGIWADLTLLYHDGRWDPLPWSFPDFRDDRYYAALTAIREAYRRKMRGSPAPRQLTVP